MPPTLPSVEEVLRQHASTYEQTKEALVRAGYSEFYAENFASLATGRSDGDVKRANRAVARNRKKK